MDWNDAGKIVGEFALSQPGELGKGLSMLWRKLHGASGDEPFVTPSGHVLTASEAILLSMFAHVMNVLAKRLGAEGTEEINLSNEMMSLSREVGKLEQLWFGDSE